MWPSLELHIAGFLDRRLLFSTANYLTKVIETKQMLLVEQNLIPSEQLSYLVAGEFIWLLLCWNSNQNTKF